RIPAVLGRGNLVPPARRFGEGLRSLRLRHPEQSQCAIRLSTANQNRKPASGICAERLASVGNRVLAQRDCVFCPKHTVFGKRKWHCERQWAAIRERHSRRAAL